MSAVFSVFSLATAKQSTHPTTKVDLPEEFAFASGKFVSLIGFKLVPTGLFLPQFWPLDSKNCRSFKRWFWKSKFYVKRQGEEVEPRAVLLRESLTWRFCLRRSGMRSYNSIVLCGWTCYVKDVSRVLLARAHSKFGRKKDIACKLLPLHVLFRYLVKMACERERSGVRPKRRIRLGRHSVFPWA